MTWKQGQKCLAHLRRHFKKLIQLPGLNNQKIGEKFVKLIDEAFKNYSLFQQNQNISELFAWAWEFKLKVKSSLDKWMALAGGEASQLLRSLRNKTDQWWYFLDHPEVPPDNNARRANTPASSNKKKG